VSLALETIAPQRDPAILATGHLRTVVVVCRQKMWRKVCVMATNYLTDRDGVMMKRRWKPTLSR
jgi:hypothetical protein